MAPIEGKTPYEILKINYYDNENYSTALYTSHSFVIHQK